MLIKISLNESKAKTTRAKNGRKALRAIGMA